MGEPTDPHAVYSLDIKVGDDGESVRLVFLTKADRIVLPMEPDRLNGLIEVLQKAAALAADRRSLAMTRRAQQ